MSGPAKHEVYEARIAAGLKQAEAAQLVDTHEITWSRWERASSDAQMPAPLWELFLHKTGQRRIPFRKLK